MKPRILFALTVACLTARAEIPPPPAATPTEINSGTTRSKYVSPYDLANSHYAGIGGSTAFSALSGLPTDNAALSTSLAAKAPLASPTLTGTPTAPSATVDTSTTQLATTAFVIGQASASGDGTPATNGVAVRGTSTHFARADHVHPTDTTRQAHSSNLDTWATKTPYSGSQPAEGDITLSDVTTNNVSTTKHGFAPKGDGNSAHYLDGTGSYSTPAGGGGSGTVTAASGALTLGHAVIGNGGTDTKVTPVTIDATTGDMANVGNVTASGAFSFGSISWGSTLVPKLNGGFGVSVAAANGIPWFSSGTLAFLSITGTGGNAIRVGGTPSDGLIPKYNVSDGSVTWQSDNTASGGTGDFSSNTSTSVDGEVVVFSGTAGKTGKRATGTGVAKITSGVLGTATPGTDYVAPSAIANMVDLTTAQTLQNKRIKLRVNSIASSATPTTNTDNFDEVKFTALAADITSMTTNLTGTPNEGDVLLFDLLDNGTARAITWGASFENGLVALPTTTTVSKHLYVTFIWQSTDSKWFCMNSASQL